MGHLHMIQTGIWSTPGKTKSIEINELVNEAMTPDKDENIHNKLPLNRNHKLGVSIFKFDELNGMLYSDLPDPFPTYWHKEVRKFL